MKVKGKVSQVIHVSDFGNYVGLAKLDTDEDKKLLSVYTPLLMENKWSRIEDHRFFRSIKSFLSLVFKGCDFNPHSLTRVYHIFVDEDRDIKEGDIVELDIEVKNCE